MTKPARLALFCLLAAAPATLLPAADAPVVIERAPDADQSAAQAEVDALRHENESLRATLAAATSAKQLDDATLKDTTRELATLRSKLARLERPAAEAVAQLAAEKARADEAIARLNTLTPALEKISQEKSALEARAAGGQDAEAKLAEAGRQLAALQTDNDLLRAAAADQVRLTAEVEKLRQEKAAAAALPDLTAKLAESEEKLSTALRSYSQLQAESEKLRSAPASTAHTDGLTAKLADTENKLATTLTSFAQLQAENEQLKSAATAHADQSAGLTAKLEAVENRLATTLTGFSQLQAENDRLKSIATDQTALAAEVEKLREEKAALETRVADTAPAPAPAPPADNSAQLTDIESKLATALRSYTLLQNENDQLKADAALTAEKAQALSVKSSGESAAQIAALFDELRQTQARANALATENAQLKTRLSLVGPPPGTTLAAPTRPGTSPLETLNPETVTPASAPAAAPAARTHVVVPGDNLAKLARQYLGNAHRWDEILRANRDVLKNENVLPVGTTLRIP